MKLTQFTTLLVFFLIHGLSAQVSTLDTVFGNFKTIDTSTYLSPNGGFVSGNNGYGDQEKMQTYPFKSNRALIGALVWYSRVELNSSDDNSKIGIRLRKVDSTAVNKPWSIKGPDTIIYEKYHTLNNIITGTNLFNSLTYYPFDYYLFPPPAFSVGIAFDSLSVGDTLACQSTKDTVGILFRKSWEMWGNEIGTIYDNWGLNIDLAIFPVFDTSLVFSNGKPIETGFVNVFPNPTQQHLNIQASFQFDWIQLIDILGRPVLTTEINPSTIYQIQNLSTLSNGSYILVLGYKDQLKSTQIIQLKNP
jgi:hypothetical protein